MNMKIVRQSFVGIGAALAVLGLYFGALALVSDWDFALEQFLNYRHFIIVLAAGFGIQVGMFVHQKKLVQGERNQVALPVTAGKLGINQLKHSVAEAGIDVAG